MRTMGEVIGSGGGPDRVGERLHALAVAFLLDRWLGDPEGWPHPVRWIGNLICRVEERMKPLSMGPAAGRITGVAVAAGLFSLALAWGRLVERLSRRSTLGRAVCAYLVYACLASSELERRARQVEEMLERGDLEGAREELRNLVGRDTEGLGPGCIARAAVESVGENVVDGVLAPLFYFSLGGLPWMLAHKAISTLDSMWGYRRPPYLWLGWAGARLDDLLVFPVARLSVPLIALASALVGEDWRAALRVGWRDRLLHPSPNSAHGEAAFAGALGVSLGGPSRYGGKWQARPVIGREGRDPETRDIGRAARLGRAVSWTGWAISVLAVLYGGRWRDGG